MTEQCSEFEGEKAGKRKTLTLLLSDTAATMVRYAALHRRREDKVSE